MIPALKYTLIHWLGWSSLLAAILLIDQDSEHSVLMRVLTSLAVVALYIPRWFLSRYHAHFVQQQQERHAVNLHQLPPTGTACFLYRPSLTLQITTLVGSLVTALLCAQVYQLHHGYQLSGDMSTP